MHILFIGGTGNISEACVELLLARGHQVTLLTRGQQSARPGCDCLVTDRNVPGALKQALAGRYFDVIADFICFDAEQAESSWEACQGRCAQFILISTTVVYAKPPAALPITENTPKGNAFSAYGRDKEAAETFFLKKAAAGFPLTIIRPSHTYSHKWIPNPVSSIGYTVAARLERGLPLFVHDDGQGLWTLTHTRDFAVGFAGLCGQPEAIGEDYQITSDFVLTWNQIIAELANALQISNYTVEKIPTDFICRQIPLMSDKLRGDKACTAVFDCAKVKRVVPDFDCRISFHAGIRESIAWFKADPARQQSVAEVDRVFDQIIAAWRQH